jgi:hypothetical protein
LGADFTAFGEHSLTDPTLFDVEGFISSPTVSSAICSACSGHPNAHNWAKIPAWETLPHRTPAEMFDLEGSVGLDLPGGFGIEFGKRLFRLSHVTRWCMFLGNQEERTVLRLVTRQICRMVGSESAIYLPDNMSVGDDVLWNGGNLEQLVETLDRTCGPLAFDPTVIYGDDVAEEALETGCFIDRFVGLD